MVVVNDTRLAEIRERLAKATPGEWTVEYEEGRCYIDQRFGRDDTCAFPDAPILTAKFLTDKETVHTHRLNVAHHVVPVTGNYDYEEGGILRTDDAEFIAHSKDDIEFLLSRLEEAERLLREAHRFVEPLLDRAERAEATIQKVRAYAEDRAFHARGHLNTVNSGRIADDLMYILEGSKS